MIDENKVMEALEAVTAYTPEEAEKLRSTVHLCCTALDSRLRSETDADDVRVIRLAAAQSNWFYLLENQEDKAAITAMKAGDVTVSRCDSTLERASALCDGALALALPLLADTQFVFAGVGE